MTTNPLIGDGHRNGAVKKPSEVRAPINDKETKRDDITGEFIAQQETEDLKGVGREK